VTHFSFKSLSFLALITISSFAFATNGYLAHGYGIKSKGMAGTGIALPQDSLIGATNPAGIVFVGNRLDLGFSIFSPRRSYDVVGNPSANPQESKLAPGKVDSDREYFIIPEFGVTWQLDVHKAFGVTVTGNGGMNTKYAASKNTFGGGQAGIDLSQLFIAPTFSYRFENNAAIGVSAILAYQRFEAKGLSQSLIDMESKAESISRQ